MVEGLQISVSGACICHRSRRSSSGSRVLKMSCRSISSATCRVFGWRLRESKDDREFWLIQTNILVKVRNCNDRQSNRRFLHEAHCLIQSTPVVLQAVLKSRSIEKYLHRSIIISLSICNLVMSLDVGFQDRHSLPEWEIKI